MTATKKRPTKADRELADRPLSRPTIPDKAWAPARGAARNDGESRSAFIERVLLGTSQ